MKRRMRVFSIVAYRPVGEVKFEHGILYYNDQIVRRGSFELLNRITVKTENFRRASL